MGGVQGAAKANIGTAQSRTGVSGFRVHCDNHYTTAPETDGGSGQSALCIAASEGLPGYSTCAAAEGNCTSHFMFHRRLPATLLAVLWIYRYQDVSASDYLCCILDMFEPLDVRGEINR